MATRAVMRHPIRAFLIAPLTVVPLAIVVIAILYLISAPIPEDGVLAIGLYAAQFVVATILGGYLFAGLYAVPVLTLAQVRNGYYVIFVAVIPVVIAAVAFHMGLASILIVVQLALLITFSCWFIGGRPKSHQDPRIHEAGLRGA